MEKQDIIAELRLQNPWWTTHEVPMVEHVITREMGDKIRIELKEKRITCIIGLRRVGKTTLLKLIIKEQLKKVDPERVFYFSFDLAKEIAPRNLVKLYFEEILKEPYLKNDDRVYIFLDEIQKV